MTQSGDLQQPLARIAALIEELERLPDPVARERARALVQAVLDIHRVGLARVLELAAARDGGNVLVDELAADHAVALLLAVHGLHPQDVYTRVQLAVDAIRPRLLDDGVLIDVDVVSDDTVRVRLRPAGTRVRASAASLRAAVESAITRNAPEIAAVEIEGLESSDVPVASLARGRPPGEG